MENESAAAPKSEVTPPEPAVPGRGRLRAFLARWVARPSKSVWHAISTFSRLAWPGFAIGSAAVILAFMAYMAWFLQSGLGRFLYVVLILIATTGGKAEQAPTEPGQSPPPDER